MILLEQTHTLEVTFRSRLIRFEIDFFLTRKIKQSTLRDAASSLESVTTQHTLVVFDICIKRWIPKN